MVTTHVLEMYYIYSFAQNTLRTHLDKYLPTNQNSSTKTRDCDQNRTEKQHSCNFERFIHPLFEELSN